MVETNEILNKKKEIAAALFETKDIFMLLANEISIQIICLLLDSPTGELNVDDIDRAIFLSRPAISHRLKMLKDKGILKVREDSRYNYYSLNKDTAIWKKICSFSNDIGDLIETLNKQCK